MGTKIFDLVTLILVFNLYIESFNLGYIFWLVGTRAFTFHMSVTRPFHEYQNIWRCDLDLDILPTY
jgi:hypothetical protein